MVGVDRRESQTVSDPLFQDYRRDGGASGNCLQGGKGDGCWSWNTRKANEKRMSRHRTSLYSYAGLLRVGSTGYNI